MKSSKSMRSISFSWLFLFLFIPLVGKTVSSRFQLPAAISQKYNGIQVGVLPQVELISIIQAIGNYPQILGFLMMQDSFEYKFRVIEHFGAWKAHPAVQMFDRLSAQPKMLNFSAPSNIMLLTDNQLKLRKDIQLDNFVLERAGGIDSLTHFLQLLKDFAEVSGFKTFFEQHHTYYQKIIQSTVSSLDQVNYIAELEHFYGIKQRKYEIVLVSLYNFVGFGNSLLVKNGKRELYNTMGPQKIVEDIPYFGDRTYLKYMIRHEFSHPFVNPLSEKYTAEVDRQQEKFATLSDKTRKMVCGEWQECVNELIIRAITTRLAFAESDEAGNEALQKEKSRELSYLEPLMEQVDIYQANRKRFPNLESYYLELLKVFEN